MKTTSYKIAVFSDLKDPQQNIVLNSIGLAKKVGGTIELLHVKKPASVVKTENQLSAMRSINEIFTETDNALRTKINALADKHSLDINYTLALGNVKAEISDFLNTVNPDIVVLGKRSSSPFKFVGDGVTGHVLKNFQGMVMIANPRNSLHSDSGFSLGLLNSDGKNLNSSLTEKLLKQAEGPLRLFKIKKGSGRKTAEAQMARKSVEYVFEPNDNAFNSLSQYISKCKVDVLVIPRNSKNPLNNTIKKAISGIDASILIANC